MSLCSAQQQIHNYLHFTTRDGLPSNNIRDVKQDKDGLLWITTKKGLAYFDGTHFFSINFNSGEQLFSTDLGQLSLSNNGLKIWITTYNQGLLCFDRTQPLEQAVKAYDVQVANGQTALQKHELYAVHVASSGLVYFGGQETDLQVLDPKSDKTQVIKLGDKNRHETIYRIREDRYGRLWIGTRYGGIYSYNPKNREITSYDLGNTGENGSSALCFVNDEVYASYYDHDMVRIDPKNRTIVDKRILGMEVNQELYENHIDDMAYDAEQQQLIATHRTEGLYSYHIPSKTLDIIGWDEISPEEPVQTAIHSIHMVREGYYLCTANGLFYYSHRFNRLQEYIPDTEKPIEKIFKIEGQLWYVTAQEIGQLSSDFKQRLSAIPLKGLRVSGIHVVGSTIYLSTYDKGIHVFDATSSSIKPLSVVGEIFGLGKADCNTVLPDTIDNEPVLWIGSWSSGLYKYHFPTKTIQRFNQQNGLPDHKIISLGKDKAGNIWLGMDGYGAVQVTDKSKGTFTHFLHTPLPSSLASNTVFNFLLDANGRFWYSSGQSGIGLIDFSSDSVTFRQDRDNNQFPWVYAYALKADDKNRIWMQTPDGVMIFHPEQRTFSQLRTGDGVFPPERFRVSNFYFDDQNIIWLTDKGLIKGEMKDVYNTDISAFSPLISAFKVLNKDHTYRLLQDAIRLNAKENTFSFTFSTPALVKHNHLRYAYRLDGVDEDWVIADDLQQAIYTNVAGGKYTFYLKVGDLDGNWSEKVLGIPVYVKTNWYQSLWFKFMVAGICFLVIFLFQAYRIKQQKQVNELQRAFTVTLQQELEANEKQIKEQAQILEREKQEKIESEFKQQLYESELKAIRSQMNPHFIFNILNSIEAYVVENDARSASKLIHKFAALSRIVLENSQFALVSIVSELQLVKLYLQLEQERFDHKFSFEIQVDEKLEKQSVKIPSMIIQPIVENAVHHGIRHLQDAGKILIRVTEQEDSIVIDILDNGVGFDSTSVSDSSPFKTTSFGLKGVEHRLNMLNGQLASQRAFFTIDNQPEEDGYTVKVTMLLPAML
ncbi:Two component regulator propeller [Sphingobacterium wenxiniae]|uniref:Two component regulator propeller n=1 Tax=Sphingobacterium wenxiniae TaxID=683125 RepID=A0A1I6VIQ4_9SPHI|nr:Two component regulator propeller [Sphingobacterium wenxiniae]